MIQTSDIKDFVESILDESMNDDQFYFLINIAKNRREDLRPWIFLRKLDSSSVVSGAGITLPTDFKSERKVRVGGRTYDPVPFEDKDLYQSASIPSGQTVNLYYIKRSSDITDSVTPVWPNVYWPLLGYDVAGMFRAGIDADDIYARMSTEDKNQAYMIADGMENWDAQAQIKAQGGRSGYANEDEAGKYTIDYANNLLFILN